MNTKRKPARTAHMAILAGFSPGECCLATRLLRDGRGRRGGGGSGSRRVHFFLVLFHVLLRYGRSGRFFGRGRRRGGRRLGGERQASGGQGQGESEYCRCDRF